MTTNRMPIWLDTLQPLMNILLSHRIDPRFLAAFIKYDEVA